jgi:transposase-like protein
MKPTTNEQSELHISVKYRRWSVDAKRALLEKAKQGGSSISAVARANRLDPSQLFSWRKQLRGIDNNRAMPISAEYRKTLLVLEQIKTANLRVAAKLMSDLQAGKVATYNGVIAHSSLTTATCKVESQRLEILEKLNSAIKAEEAIEKNKVSESEDTEEQRMQQQLAERLLVLHARRQSGLLTVDELNQWCQGAGLGSLIHAPQN